MNVCELRELVAHEAGEMNPRSTIKMDIGQQGWAFRSVKQVDAVVSCRICTTVSFMLREFKGRSSDSAADFVRQRLEALNEQSAGTNPAWFGKGVPRGFSPAELKEVVDCDLHPSPA